MLTYAMKGMDFVFWSYYFANDQLHRAAQQAGFVQVRDQHQDRVARPADDGAVHAGLTA